MGIPPYIFFTTENIDGGSECQWSKQNKKSNKIKTGVSVGGLK